jgi:hypothetical protein
MKTENTRKAKNEQQPAAQQRSALSGWDNEGGAGPADRELKSDTEPDKRGERAARRAEFDSTHDSSARGEHRYSDTHQTGAEQKARGDRDALKRKLQGRR